MRARASITGPLVLIGIGVVFLIRAVSPDFRIFDLLALYWPYILIGWGVIGLLEVLVAFARGGPIPVNGVSGAAWLLVAVICLLGLASFEMHRPNTWWRQIGFERGVEAFGEEHQYSIDPLQRSVGSAPHLVIENFRGDAKLIGGDGNQLTVSGHKTVRSFDSHEADRANSQTPVEIVLRGETVVIRCNQDKASARTPVTTDLEITLPKAATVEATGVSGDFDISSVSGNVDISSENAGVRLQEVGGDVRIDTRRSDLVRCTNVGGSVDLRGHGRDVELTKIAGQVTVSGDYNGSVSLRELAKPVEVKSMRTTLSAQRIPGELHLDRGSLSVENVVGPLRLTTHVTDVSLDGFTDTLDLSVDKGDVDIRPGHLPLGKMLIHTHSGNIELALPQSADFALSASTDHGDIDNQFGDSLKEQTSGRGARLAGSVGNGPDVSLVTDRGSITVRKSTGEPTTPSKVAGIQETRAHRQLAPLALALIF